MTPLFRSMIRKQTGHKNLDLRAVGKKKTKPETQISFVVLLFHGSPEPGTDTKHPQAVINAHKITRSAGKTPQNFTRAGFIHLSEAPRAREERGGGSSAQPPMRAGGVGAKAQLGEKLVRGRAVISEGQGNN